jgi:hypothetical protein
MKNVFDSSNPIPSFSGSWSSQMTAFLKDKDSDFILNHITQICESWGDDSKSDVVEWVVNQVVSDMAVRELCLEKIIEWAGW